MRRRRMGMVIAAIVLFAIVAIIRTCHLKSGRKSRVPVVQVFPPA